MDGSLIDLVITTSGVILVMILLSFLCCVCMKYSDLKLKYYIIDTARRKGLKLDPEKLEPKHSCQSPLASENCTIMIPDVGIIL